MTDSNPPLLTALTWGTVITALVSALLLAAAGPGLPTHEDARQLDARRQPAAAERRMQATNDQRSPVGASSTRRH